MVLHLKSLRPQIYTNLRPTSKRSRLPAPVAAKTGTMPAHEGLGPNEAIPVREVDTTAHLTLEHDQLMSERGILREIIKDQIDRPG
jgi:hypothetical protein